MQDNLLELEPVDKQLFEAVTGISENEAKSYIEEIIIPQMDKRRGRTQPLSEDNITNKLYSPPSSDKQGEYSEFLQELRNALLKQITPDLALEAADFAFYCSQKNHKTSPDENALMVLCFDGWSIPYMFCIIKYLTRIKYGDEPDHKERELVAMDSFLDYLTKKDEYKWLLWTIDGC